ncbi:hypothetical protein B0T17DRAFT_327106 [Bombardia bombarda]|uniref:Secreted protein n=1 Tax=Bombardia bombarda TaxID=252184 RepID=A0AA39WMK4_9PEZI|nr:hypothetical protein B0T17DRAFT_327106 [Bombardia bombarda]
MMTMCLLVSAPSRAAWAFGAEDGNGGTGAAASQKSHFFELKRYLMKVTTGATGGTGGSECVRDWRFALPRASEREPICNREGQGR